ncbi:DUF488 family protein [Vallicoccus soli]|uniref:DUF488 domain-containing protein n=1 Tax=Vallicoccus soli TaxID=2339232 RepID=UPI002482A7C1|nr:DUF488 domain-containing protein [Vallicoccus soli]
MALLAGAGVEELVDVRRFPGSRRHPDVAGPALAAELERGGVAYRWEEALGGRRRLAPGDPSPDAWWQVASFRAYAAHTRTPGFRAALDALLDGAAGRRTAVLCSEAVWWRCHRRLVADVAVLARGRPVDHLMPDGRLAPHRPAAGARVVGDDLVWDGPPQQPQAPVAAGRPLALQADQEPG